MNNYQKLKPNSFKKTFCIFDEVELNTIDNLKLTYESGSGSKYYYNENGMFRLSNHWGSLANSKWHLVQSEIETESKFKLGFAKFESFFADNDFDAIYYLEYNKKKSLINYNHCKNPDYDKKAILRTTFDTKKRIKHARNILNLSNWAKYYETDIDELRISIINELIYTNKSLDEIKRSLL